MRFALLLVVAVTVVLQSTANAKEFVIQNKLVRVVLNSVDHSFSIERVGTDSTFVKQGLFPREVTRVEKSSVVNPVWGSGETIRLSHPGRWNSVIEVFPNSPFVHIHREVGNDAKAPVVLNAFRFLDFDVDLGVEQQRLRVLGTGGLTSVAKSEGSYAFSAIADPETRHGVVCGWLTHERGVGVFFPRAENGRTSIKAQIDFGRYQVEPKQSRPTETLLIGYFDDARLGLEAYADAIAKQYKIQLPPKPGVYCTWYHAGASNESKLAENTEFAARTLKPYGLSVIQIDDKWQSLLPKGFTHEGEIKKTGPIKVFADANGNFPHGMAQMARQISEKGMTPGIWFMPFAGNFRNPYFDPEIFAKNPDGSPFHDERWSGTCIDVTNPQAEKFVRERVRRLYDWGYRYFKIDGMHTGAVTYNTYVNTSYGNKDFGKVVLYNPAMTQIEAYRVGLRILREEAPGVFVLGCNVSQNMRSMGPAFGMIDAMRIGPDNGAAANGRWDQVITGAWHGTNLYFLNNRVWHNDPDPVYPRASNPLERARWMCSWMAVAGAMHTSSEQYADLPEDRLELLRRCLPSHQLPARPVDLFETNQPRIWHVQNDRLHVIGLFNWQENSADEIRCSLDKLGLDGEKMYVGYEFWSNEAVGPISAELQRTVAPASCQVLALREIADHPQLLSTSRHITQGLIDVLSETWNPEEKRLSGDSALVGGDPYELRIALPSAGVWEVDFARVTPADPAVELDVRVIEQNTKICRVVITSAKSQQVHWTVKYR